MPHDIESRKKAEIAERVRTRIQDLGVTATEIGRRMGAGPGSERSVVAKILAGAIPREYSKLERLAGALGMSIDELVSGSEAARLARESRERLATLSLQLAEGQRSVESGGMDAEVWVRILGELSDTLAALDVPARMLRESEHTGQDRRRASGSSPHSPA